MTSTSFTTRLDTSLKKRLEKLARRDNRSASYMANLAIRNLVEDREATRELVQLGRQLAKTGPSVSEEAIDTWLNDPAETPWPADKLR